jgi:hypothetical protein
MTWLQSITLHQIFDWAGAVVLVSSLLGTFLPPYDWFDKWPRFQAVYKIFVMTITKWGSLNLKSVVYPAMTMPRQIAANTDEVTTPKP